MQSTRNGRAWDHRDRPENSPLEIGDDRPERPQDRFAGSAAGSPQQRADLAILLLVVAAIQLLTMPAFFYPGDTFAARAEAVWLMDEGTLGIPYSEREQLGDFLSERGQYFFEHDEKRLLFSKYGIGYTLLYLPPLLMEKQFSRPMELLSQTRTLLLILNLYGVILTLISASYLFFLAREFSSRPRHALVFSLAAIYATFLWHYLRAPALEVFQIAFFLAFLFHSLRFLKLRRQQAGVGNRAWMHLLFATLAAGVLVALKFSFALSPAILVPFALLAGPSGSSAAATVIRNVRLHWRCYLTASVVPGLILAALLAWVNAVKFGAATDSGYGQWLGTDSVPVAFFSTAFLSESLAAFFVRPGNSNVFLHFPLVLLGVPFWSRFARRFPLEAGFLAALVGVNFFVLASFSVWHGEWGYGPRYLLFFLIPAALPVLQGPGAVVSLPSPLARRAVAATAGLVVAWSLILQVQVNALHYFTHYYARGMVQSVWQTALDREPAAHPLHHQPRIRSDLSEAGESVSDYFDRVAHRGLIHRDILAHGRGRRGFPPLELLVHSCPVTGPEFIPRLDSQLRRLAEWNLYLVRRHGGPGPLERGRHSLFERP